MESWPLLLGWPVVLLALTLSVVGLVRGQSIWLFIAVVFLLPISFYLAGTPRFGWVALAVPFFLVGAGIAVKWRRIGVAWAFHLPIVIFFGYLGILVLSE